MNRTRVRSRRCWRAVAGGGMLAAFLACGPALPALAGSAPSSHPSATPSAAQAADSCDTVVVDTTPTHVLGNDSAVAKATQQLENKGADVRVRVFPTTPGSSLDAYRNAAVAACPSWSLGGQIEPKLLVFLVALDHNDAIYYGKDYGSRLQGKVDQIRTDMGSDFRAGNFAAGIAKAEQETYTALYSSSSTASSDSVGLSGEIIGWVVLALGATSIVVVFRLIWRRIRTGRRGSGRTSGWGGGDGNTVFFYGNDYGGGGDFGGGGGDAGGSSGTW